MAYETIIVEKRDNIAVLTMNRPDQFNSWTFRMVTEMSDALQALAKDEEIRALVMIGSGKNFCIGDAGDVEFVNKTPLEISAFLEASSHMIQMFADFPKGTVVAAHGLAVMGGAFIAFLGDITIMSEEARIGFTAIDHGVSCMIVLPHLRHIVGSKKALELVLTGRLLHADEALQIGLVTTVVPTEKLFETAMETAKLLASKNPLAVAFTKRANAATRDMSMSSATRYLDEHLTLLATSEDCLEGMTASREKRPPQWKGR